jgi:hypothetical protein
MASLTLYILNLAGFKLVSNVCKEMQLFSGVTLVVLLTDFFFILRALVFFCKGTLSQLIETGVLHADPHTGKPVQLIFAC